MLARSFSKSSKLGFNSTWTKNFQMCKLDLEKAEESEIKLPQHPLDHRKSKRIPEKHSEKKKKSKRIPEILLLHLLLLQPLTAWITANCGKFLRRWEYQNTLHASWRLCMQVKKQQLEPHMEQLTVSKLGKEYDKAVYCHPACLTYMQSTSCKMLGWMSHKLESRLLGEIWTTSDMQMYHSNSRKWRELKSLLMKVKEESEKVGIKLNIQKIKIMTSSPISSWKIEGEKVETVTDFIFLGFRITVDGDCSHEIKRHSLLGGKTMTNLGII